MKLSGGSSSDRDIVSNNNNDNKSNACKHSQLPQSFVKWSCGRMTKVKHKRNSNCKHCRQTLDLEKLCNYILISCVVLFGCFINGIGSSSSSDVSALGCSSNPCVFGVCIDEINGWVISLHALHTECGTLPTLTLTFIIIIIISGWRWRDYLDDQGEDNYAEKFRFSTIKKILNLRFFFHFLPFLVFCIVSSPLESTVLDRYNHLVGTCIKTNIFSHFSSSHTHKHTITHIL